MPNALGIREQDFPVTLQFIVTDVAADAITDGTLASGGAGWIVPAGFEFHPLMLHAEANEAVTAQSIAVKVIVGGTEATNGPEVTLSATAQAASGLKGMHGNPIYAGSVVSVSAETPAGFTPITADLDVILNGVLVG
jgi:hypothetical protein